MALNLSDQLYVSLGLPLDSRLSNLVIVGSTIVVETKEDYLYRVDANSRYLNMSVSFYEPSGIYNINEFLDLINSGTISSLVYSFFSGLEDEDFETSSVDNPVISVNGKTGNVELDSDDIPEGTINKYYPQEDKDKLDSLGPPELTSDLTATVTVGGVSSGDDYFEGDLLEQLLRDILAPYVTSTINSLTISLTPSKSTYEVGETITINNASFTYSNDSNNNPPIDFRVTGLGFDGSAYQSSPIISDGSNYKFTSIETSSWSIIAKNGQNQDTNSRTYSRSSRRYAFYGTSSIPTNSTEVRALSGKTFLNASNNGSFTIFIPAGEKQISFSIPSGKVPTVLFRESSNADVTGSFTVNTFIVNDAAGDPQTYDTYTTILAGSGYGSDSNYDITIN